MKPPGRVDKSRQAQSDNQVQYLTRFKVFPTPYLPPKCKKSNKFVSCVFFCTSAYVLYDQNTVIIYVNLMPNYFSQYCMLGCF